VLCYSIWFVIDVFSLSLLLTTYTGSLRNLCQLLQHTPTPARVPAYRACGPVLHDTAQLQLASLGRRRGVFFLASFMFTFLQTC
jgi:hypothetical protein